MTQKKRRDAGDSASSAPDFEPVKLRYRRDGWTPERQVAFIRALVECGCVAEACRRVGLSTESAYKLYRRPDAAGFRRAWDEALATEKARRMRPLAPPSPALPAPPSRPLRAIRPAAAAPARAAIPPAGAAPARTSWQASTSSTSSTSAAPAAETNGMCPGRRLHQLPRGHQLPAGRETYSLESFVRAVVRARRR